jgi:Zn-dependent alcohol dehydrogenase
MRARGRGGGGRLVSAEISLDQIESGYQKLADPEVSRVVITRF